MESETLPERVVSYLSAQGQVAARHLVDHRQQVGDAALQRFRRFLVVGGF